MTNIRVTYKVVGRCLKGKEISAYVFIGSDNSQLILNKDRTIYMIGKGMIENMRIQTVNNEVIIRGKGVNLNTLPAYDENKQSFRGNDASQTVANNGVHPRNTPLTNNMSQFEIVKRIMMKNTCIGYVVRDMAGNTKRLDRQTVVRLGIEKRLSNAVIQRLNNKDGSNSVVLRGVGCEIKKLPILIVDEQGKIIDPNVNKNEVVLRAAKMKRGGVITNIVSNRKKFFSFGDFLVCKADGTLDMIQGTEFIRNFKQDTEHGTATCDYYLDKLQDYTVELFGGYATVLNPNQVKTWTMIKHI